MSWSGMSLDQSLTGKCIVDNVVKKANNKIKFLYRNTRHFDIKTKKMLVSALIQCHFDYACSAWYGNITQLNRKRLQVSQNKCIRFILGLQPRAHVGAFEFQECGMLPVNFRVSQLRLNHMFNIFHGVAPSYLQGGFER